MWKWLKGTEHEKSEEKILMHFFSHLIRLSDAYNFDFMAEYEENQVKSREEMKVKKLCGNCQKDAEKKCSRCEVVFYCCRLVKFFKKSVKFSLNSPAANAKLKIGLIIKRSAISMSNKRQ